MHFFSDTNWKSPMQWYVIFNLHSLFFAHLMQKLIVRPHNFPKTIPKQTKKAIISQKYNSTSQILIIFILNVIKVSRMQSTEWNWNRKLFSENGVVNGRRFFKMRKLYRAQVTTYCSDRKIQELCHSFELYCCSE